MLRFLRALRGARRLRDDEQGVALATVVGIGAVVTILVATMVAVSSSGITKSNTNRDWANAISAAYAGLANYQFHMSADQTYWNYGSSSTFGGSSRFTGTNSNDAFTGWVGVPNATGTVPSATNAPAGAEFYRYEVDNRRYVDQGIVKLRVTGKSGATTRSLVASVKSDGFSNYLYWTDFESSDPTFNSGCTSAYVIDQRSGSSYCQQVTFAPNDELFGPVRSNDTINICGSTFHSTVQSPQPVTHNCDSRIYGSGNMNGSYDLGSPTIAPTLTPPTTIQTMLDQVDPTKTDTPGCLYTGPTKITFNSGGTVTVVSPQTIATNVVQATLAASTPANCGAVSGLRSTSGSTFTPTAGTVMYVQNPPARRSGSTQDPNYWYSSNAAAPSCSSGSASTGGNGVGFPYAGEKAPSYTYGTRPTTTIPAYSCQAGDLFVKGTVSKSLTVAAENFAYVTGDLTYASPRQASTVLGLIGEEAVWVWNPVDSSRNLIKSSGVPITGVDREIDAALLSNDGQFGVQNYDQGNNRGTLTVVGSIAQKYRGAVAVASSGSYSGYAKSYKYDSSLASFTPPAFPTPIATTFKVASQIEVPAAFAANGTCIRSGSACR